MCAFTILLSILIIPSCNMGTKAPNETLLLESKLDSLFLPLTNEDIISGNILVGCRDKILINKSYGLANREHNIPLTD